MRFVEADVRSYQDDEPFDAVVARALLFHVSDPRAVLRHHAAALSPGGRPWPSTSTLGRAVATRRSSWSSRAATGSSRFRHAGLDPMIGARLPLLLREAGVAEVESLGVQHYLVRRDPAAAGWIANVIRSLAPQIVAAGITAEAELTLEDYERRVARADGLQQRLSTACAGRPWGARY